MRVSHGACNNYRPESMQRWREETGNLCSGFGASPRCLSCGKDEQAHERRKRFEEDDSGWAPTEQETP